MADTYPLQGSTPGATPSKPAPAPAPAPRPGPAASTRANLPPVPPPPKATNPTPPPDPKARLTSLDAYRGAIMVLLAASGFGIAQFSRLPIEAPVWHRPVATSTGLHEATAEDAQARRDWWQPIGVNFEPPAWRSDFLLQMVDDPTTKSDWQRLGVSAWDLIQPAFMFMVGVAMPFSFRRRAAEGATGAGRFLHALLRAVILVLLGVFLATRTGEPTLWVFPNVLAQIGLGYFIVYLLLGFRWWVQAAACAIILGGYWYFMQIGYWQLSGQPRPNGQYDSQSVGADAERGEVLIGRFAPWSKNDNAAHYVDVRLLNALADPDGRAMEAWRTRIAEGPLSFGERVQYFVRRTFFSNPKPFVFNSGGYQTLNFIPSMATMLIGVMCGGLLMSDATKARKLLLLVLAALLCLLLGRVLGIYVCPIVKRIWTPSWALFSGGYVIALLALFYFLFDILPLRWLAFPLVIVGMNSMAMYMMGQLMRPFAREKIVRPHLTGFIDCLLGTDPVRDGPAYLLRDDMFGRLIEPTAILAVFWLIAFWMWRRRIFVRI